ncbi:hypothetical protein [Neolewinella litorea]|uniref:Uncharacterized protein n=1 Tax=Neolewinella litorea TaxID=2562452 RepID=A0A4S4NM80_9BACT|nr:hypothetical protein [Neolewinella litorea]THH40027.1 hypothetical protein E4021_10515 [Neolewinella litorea]
MKSLYTVLFVVFALLFAGGAFGEVKSDGTQIWVEVLLAAGLLILFGLFATVLLLSTSKAGEA